MQHEPDRRDSPSEFQQASTNRRDFLVKGAAGTALYTAPAIVIAAPQVGLSPTPPIVTSVTPPSGGPGTIITILGSRFDPNPLNNCVALDGGPANRAVVRVLSSSPTQITGEIQAVGNVGSTIVGVATGTGTPLPNTNVNLGGLTSQGTQASMFVGNLEGMGGNFNLTSVTPPPNFVAGTFAFGALNWTLTGVWVNGTMLFVDIHLKTPSGLMDYKKKITFGPGFGTAQDCANHVAAHLAGAGFLVSVAGSTITVSKPGATGGWGHWRLM